MNKGTVVGMVVGAVAMTAIGAVASFKLTTTRSVAETPSATVLPPEIAAPAPGESAPAPAPQPPMRTATTSPPPSPPRTQYAQVVAVTPVTQTVSTPREACHDEEVTHTAPTSDSHQVVGTVAGAVLGGVIGHQFGAGKGKTAMTVAGAVAGGYAGNKVEEKVQESHTTTTTERRCETVTDTQEQTIGYDVTYRWNGQDRVTRMDQAPGTRIEMRNGKPVSPGASAKS